VLSPEATDAIRNADVILSLDWLDVAGTFKQVGNVTAKVVQVSVDHHLHNGWSMDYQGLPPVDVFIACEPDVAVPALRDALGPGGARALAPVTREFPKLTDGKLTVDHLADALRNAVGPTLALTGVQFTFLIGGTVIVERIFSYPGLGNLAIDAVIGRDFPLIQGLILLFGLIFILVNLAVNVAVALLNPRLRHG